MITSKNYPLFSRLWAHQAFLYDMKDSLGAGIRNYKSLYSGTYMDSGELRRLSSTLKNKIRKDIRLVWRICRNWEKDCKALIEYTKKLENKGKNV